MSHRGIAWTLLVLVLIAGIQLRLSQTPGANLSPDEQSYIGNARVIANGGLDQVRVLFRNYNSDSRNWVYPAPTRFFNVWLFAMASRITGLDADPASHLVTRGISILMLLLTAWIGLRFFNVWIAVLSVSFLAFHLGELAISRRAFQDNCLGFLALLLVWFSCEITRDCRDWRWYAPFFLTGIASIITKDSAWLSYGCCGLWIFGVWLLRERNFRISALVAALGLTSIAVAVSIWAFLAGGFQPALAAAWHLAAGTPGNAFLQQCCSGPWYYLPYLLWITGPLTAVLAAIGIVVMILGIRDRWMAGPVLLMLVVFFSFASFAGNWKYLRAVAPADGSYCLMAGLGLWWLMVWIKQFLSPAEFRTAVGIVVLVVAVAAARDLQVLQSTVVDTGMQELSIFGFRYWMTP